MGASSARPVLATDERHLCAALGALLASRRPRTGSAGLALPGSTAGRGYAAESDTDQLRSADRVQHHSYVKSTPTPIQPKHASERTISQTE